MLEYLEGEEPSVEAPIEGCPEKGKLQSVQLFRYARYSVRNKGVQEVG